MRRLTYLHPALWLPPSFKPQQEAATSMWPRCAVCNDAVGAYEIADVGSGRLEIVAKCGHGVKPIDKRDEECLRITWDSDSVTWEDVAHQISRLVFFQRMDVPEGVTEIGAGRK